MSDVTSRAWWRWMPGMVDQHGRCIIDVNTGRNEGVPVEWADAIACDVVEMYERPDDARAEWADAVPDETDPTTLGCLTQRARELWGARAHTIPTLDGWVVWAVVGRHWERVGEAGTELAALVAACDAAPVSTTTTKDTP